MIVKSIQFFSTSSLKLYAYFKCEVKEFLRFHEVGEGWASQFE